jgi:trehalose synthase
MLHSVDVGKGSLDAFRDVAPDAILDRLRALSSDLRGLRVLHLNATPYGGGVSELPVLNDLGVVAEWKVISGDESFFSVTKAIHNGLQGAELDLTEAERATYAATSERNARLLEEVYDVVVVHDPQPAAILPIHGRGGGRWIWRCHIDTSSPNPEVWAFVRSHLDGYDAAIFTMREFLPPDLPIGRVEIVPPAIDPLSPKNLDIGERTALQVLSWIGVDLDRPLVTQISRFDPWKDPLGVIAAYRLAREEVPGLQLALAGSMALDDPEGWEIYREIQGASAADPLIHVFTNLTGVGNIEVNALQRLSQVVIQKSIREGFGLVVSEALWKGTPVVAGRAGGIPLQLADGAGGVLVESVEECAQAIVALLNDPDHAAELGRRGRERVREHFLLPRLILDELTLIRYLTTGVRIGPPSPERDPVCGMTLTGPDTAPSAAFAGATYRFCSDDCRARFELAPERYARKQVGSTG